MKRDTLLAYQLSTKPEQGIMPSHKDGELEETHSVRLPAMKNLSWSRFATVNLETESKYGYWIPFTFSLIYSYIHHKWLLGCSHRSIRGLRVKMDTESFSDL